MNRTTPIFLAFLLLMALSGVGLLLWAFILKPDHRTERDKLHDYCTSVAIALERDTRDFEHGSPTEIDAAATRFGEQVTFHSEYEINLCTAKPVDLTRRGLCAIKPDAGCLAELARTAALAIREGL